MSKRALIKGTAIIAFAGVFSKFIGLFFRIPLTNLLGEEGIGIYSFPMTLFIPLSAIVIQGPPTVIAKLISEKYALNKTREVDLVYKASKQLMMIIGFMVTLTMLVLMPIFVKYVWSKDIILPYLTLSITPMFLSISSVYAGLYQGLQDMKPIAYQQIADGLGRLIFGLFFTYIFIQKGLIYGATGAVTGTVLGAFSGLLVIQFYHFRNKMPFKNYLHKKSAVKKYQKLIFKSALPISIGAIGASLIPLVDAVLIQNRLATAGFMDTEIYSLNGVLSNTNALINVPLIIGVAISFNLIPSISAAKVKSRNALKSRIQSGLLLSISMALPSGVGLFLVGKTVFSLFYPAMSTDHYLVEIYAVSIIISMINQSFIAILQATDHIKVPVRHFYIGLCIKFLLSYILIAVPLINIHGTAISTFIAYIVISSLNYRAIKNYLALDIRLLKWIIKPLLNTIIMAIAVIICLEIGKMFGHATLFSLIAIVIGVIIYGILLLNSKIVELKDVAILNRWVNNENN